MVTTTSMPFPALEPTSCPTVAASSLQTSRSSADADARRLAAAVARGDEAAFRQLYDRYQPRLFRLALVLGRGDESLAQDTVQSVFVTAAAKLRRVDGEEHLWNWLARVARQQLAKAWRQRQRDSAVVGMADLPEQPGCSQTRFRAGGESRRGVAGDGRGRAAVGRMVLFRPVEPPGNCRTAQRHAQGGVQPSGTGAREAAFTDYPEVVP